MRLFLTMLAAGVAFGISLAIIAGVAPEKRITRAGAGSDSPDSWESARATLADLRRIASQSCSFLPENGGIAPDVFVDRFRAAAADYRRAVQSVGGGEAGHPADLPAAAPAIEELHLQMCADAIPVAVEAPPPVATQAPSPNMDFAGLYGAQYLTLEQLDAAAYLAGWPMTPGWWPEMRLIVQCESGRNIFAYNGSDPNGGSYGLAQLNGTQHFDRSGENFEHRFDPIVNLRTALWLRSVRGHFGGAGGWKTCSELYGIS